MLYKKNNFIAAHRPMLALPPCNVVFTEVPIAGMLHYGVRYSKNLSILEAFVRLRFQGQWRFVMWSLGLKFHISSCVGINASEAHSSFVCRVEYVSSILIHIFLMYDIFTRLHSAITRKATMSFFFRFSYNMPVIIITIYQAQWKWLHILNLWFKAKRTALMDFMLFTHSGLIFQNI